MILTVFKIKIGYTDCETEWDRLRNQNDAKFSHKMPDVSIFERNTYLKYRMDTIDAITIKLFGFSKIMIESKTRKKALFY